MITKDNSAFMPPANETNHQKAMRTMSKMYDTIAYMNDLKNELVEIVNDMQIEINTLRADLDEETL